ncbi:MAG: transporter substrate-binding domain-containing protein, partial [Clostridiales bacterium]|nr:transporter substrate-binding domain-containing protein [Clostridiales bacterium]
MAFLFFSCSDNVPASTVNSLNDLGGKTIGVLENTAAAYYASRHGALRIYSTGEAMIADLKAGAIDCAVADEPVAQALLGHSRKVRMLEEPLISVDFCIVAAKESRDLLEDINTALSELRADGTLAGLENYYLLGTPYDHAPKTDIPESAGA